MKNQEISRLLKNMGTLLEVKGELIFKIRAYFKAAENISNLTEDISLIRQEKRLSEIPGVGKAIEEKIGAYLDTGKIPAYEKLIKEVPESLLDVINVPSVGPKKAKLFFDELKIKNLADLKKAADSGKLLQLEGIKEKTIENIQKGIGIVTESNERMNRGVAMGVAMSVIKRLKTLKCVEDAEFAGSLRRGKETSGDIDILVNSNSPKEVMDVFLNFDDVKSINAKGETKSSIITQDNVQVDLRVVAPEHFGSALLYFTGSKEFNVKLRQIAIKQNKKVNEYGVFQVKGEKEKSLAGLTEKDCFKALDLPFVEPELREEIGLKHVFGPKKLPALVKLEDIQGELHVHSVYSDGKNSMEDMAKTAIKRGYKYLAISDHSQKLKIARGVSPEDLIKKRREMDSLNKKFKNFKLLMGSEVEIDTNGNLDYNDAILSELDVVIAAIHTGFEQSRERLTSRLVKACQNKHVNVIAHPTGVHLGKREPYDLDFQAVCQAASDHNVCLEINSFPIRLDLNTQNVYYAKEKGVRFVINTDSHRTAHMDYIQFGVSIARRGWLTKKDVLNTQSCSQLLKSLEK